MKFLQLVPECLRYLCYDHLDNSICINDHEIKSADTVSGEETVKISQSKVNPENNNCPEPETFEVDGNQKEGATLDGKKIKKLIKEN